MKSTKDEKTRIRPARESDLTAIVHLLAEDPLGSLREDNRDPLPHQYLVAFEAIAADGNQELIVLVNERDEVIGTLQLSFLRYLTYRGGLRAQIEAVRIRSDHRQQGLGQRLFSWAISRAKSKGAHLVQLTTDKQRPVALRFYRDLGFQASHEGMKLHL